MNPSANQSATGTCADRASNTASGTRSGIDIDLTDPGVTWNGSITDGDHFYFGSVPVSPTCTATDVLSGPKSCNVTGYNAAVGSHTLAATALDNAGNGAVETRDYDVLAWTLTGFYQPVDMSGVLNIIKGGSTVPLKFEIVAGSEITSTSAVKSFNTATVSCSDLSGMGTDEIEVTSTGGTSLRYDSTGGQFIQNWRTPKASGICYSATLTTQDGSSLVAYFKTR